MPSRTRLIKARGNLLLQGKNSRDKYAPCLQYCSLLKNNSYASCSAVRLLTKVDRNIDHLAWQSRRKCSTIMQKSFTRVEDIIDKPATHDEAKIIIADDHELARESIHKMLESEPHLQVLAEARDGQEVIELCRLQHPDLVLMDVRIPKVNGFEATRIIKAELPTTKVLMMSAHFDRFLISEVERADADGYVTELCSVQELVDAIRGVLRGESHYPSVSEK